MKKVGLIALREFLAAVANRGFLIGLLMMPVLGGIIAIAAPYVGPQLLGPRLPVVRGQIILRDPTGVLAADLRSALDPMAIAAKRADRAQTAMADAPELVRRAASSQVLESAAGPQPQFRVVEHPATRNFDEDTAWLMEDSPDDHHLAVVVIHPDAIVTAAGAPLGGYDLFVSGNLDRRVENVIHEGVQEAIVSARVSAAKVDRVRVEALMRVSRPEAVTVTKDKRRSGKRFQRRAADGVGGLSRFWRDDWRSDAADLDHRREIEPRD